MGKGNEVQHGEGRSGCGHCASHDPMAVGLRVPVRSGDTKLPTPLISSSTFTGRPVSAATPARAAGGADTTTFFLGKRALAWPYTEKEH